MNLLRINQFQTQLKEQGVEALLVSNYYDILYLTGFKGVSPDERECWLLLTHDEIYFFTDGRYEIVAENYFFSTDIKLHIISPEIRLTQWLETITKEKNLTKIYFDTYDLKFYEYEQFKKRVQVAASPVSLQTLREVKDSDELGLIRKACELTDTCLNDVSKLIKDRVTEKELHWHIEKWIKSSGYDLAFEPIVAFQSNSSLPHYHTKSNNTRLTKNNLILIDMGVKYKDYCSDITRMFYYGTPDNELMNIYNKLLAVQQSAIDYCSAHIDQEFELKKIDLFVRGELVKAHLPNMPHSTGHGVGLQIHETPSISLNSKYKLKSGQVFTIEPGIYIEHTYGMRIEDSVCIHNNIEILTKYTKKLTIISP